MSATTTHDPVDVLARTIWAEARSTGPAGMRHVASVIMNRAKHPRWWGSDVVSVCLQPWQFSCWNAGDPNLPKLKAVTTADPEFFIAQGIARDAISGNLLDETGGADSYFAASMAHPPAWSVRANHTLSDGFHKFWRVELPALNGDADAHTIAMGSPNSRSPDESADALNQQQLDRIKPA